MNAAAIDDEIDDIRERHRRNLPRHRNPEAYHDERREIDKSLEVIAAWLRTGRKPD